MANIIIIIICHRDFFLLVTKISQLIWEYFIQSVI